MWTQISLIRNPIRRVSSKPDGRPLPSRAHASGPAPRRSRRAASPAPGRRSGLAAAPARPSNPRLLCRRAANLWPCLRAPRARSSHALPGWRVAAGGGCPRRRRAGSESSLAWGAFARAARIGSSRTQGNFSPQPKQSETIREIWSPLVTRDTPS